MQAWTKPEITQITLEPEEDVLLACWGGGANGYQYNNYCHTTAPCHSK